MLRVTLVHGGWGAGAQMLPVVARRHEADWAGLGEKYLLVVVTLGGAQRL